MMSAQVPGLTTPSASIFMTNLAGLQQAGRLDSSLRGSQDTFSSCEHGKETRISWPQDTSPNYEFSSLNENFTASITYDFSSFNEHFPDRLVSVPPDGLYFSNSSKIAIKEDQRLKRINAHTGDGPQLSQSCPITSDESERLFSKKIFYINPVKETKKSFTAVHKEEIFPIALLQSSLSQLTTKNSSPPTLPSEISKHFTKHKENRHQPGTGNLVGKLSKHHPSTYGASPHRVRKSKSVSEVEELKQVSRLEGLTASPQMSPKQKTNSHAWIMRQWSNEAPQLDHVKKKMTSVWNNIKYGWTLQSASKFKYDSPLFMLGKCYHRLKDDSDDPFLGDFVSRIWMTYRSNFFPLAGTGLITDCGWGCMLRSGQMLIAQCLVNHHLGRDWMLHHKQTDTSVFLHKEIIRWFSDPVTAPTDDNPFCLHSLTQLGRAYHKDPGDWYGPATVAYIFRDAFAKASQTIAFLSMLCVYVAQDCTIFIDDVLRLCTRRFFPEPNDNNSSQTGADSCLDDVYSSQWLRSLILLIPVRLGGEAINEIYIPCVKSLLAHDKCVGIMGGRPRHSLYFIGWQDKKLIYLDPHLCQDTVDTAAANFDFETFHCTTPRKLAFSKMDPSCTIGFYIKNREDLMNFVDEVKEFISPPKQKGVYPLFTFCDGQRPELDTNLATKQKDRKMKIRHYYIDPQGQKTFSGESEEFVVL